MKCCGNKLKKRYGKPVKPVKERGKVKLTPERRRQIYEITQKILAVYDRFFSFVLKLYEKPVERKKREFFLTYRTEMTEEEIREYQYRLTVGWTVILFIFILLLLEIGGRIFG